MSRVIVFLTVMALSFGVSSAVYAGGCPGHAEKAKDCSAKACGGCELKKGSEECAKACAEKKAAEEDQES